MQIRILNVELSYEDWPYRTPYMFGGRSVDRATLLNVRCEIAAADGRTCSGFGSMSLGNMWAFPSRALSYDQTLAAMKALAARIRSITVGCGLGGHPIELNIALEPEYLRAAAEVSRELALAEPIPKLCTMVVASPFDLALHDAYGKAHGLSSYAALGQELLRPDLSRALLPHICSTPRRRIFVYHSVGASDPLFDSDVQTPVGDGLPETLGGWIRRDGISHIKIKLNGNDLAADLDRVVAIDRASAEAQAGLGISSWFYCLDFNEQCPDGDYLLEFLYKLRERRPAAFDRIQYIEQPTARDLAASRSNRMHEAARLRPVVIDESLTDLETLERARELGYTGVALKACKQLSQALLMAAAARERGMFLCVQDLTCPGAAFIASAGLAAHARGVTAMEANARQYVPRANQPWESRFPGLFRVSRGAIETAALTGPGLGF